MTSCACRIPIKSTTSLLTCLIIYLLTSHFALWPFKSIGLLRDRCFSSLLFSFFFHLYAFSSLKASSASSSHINKHDITYCPYNVLLVVSFRHLSLDFLKHCYESWHCSLTPNPQPRGLELSVVRPSTCLTCVIIP
jgi:hypothetical protein